jgi:tetratricopeptide (TPR) repeat protein
MVTEKPVLQHFRDGDDPREQARVWLEAGQSLIRHGDLDEARGLLQAAVQAEPNCTEAWLQLAWLAHDPRQRRALLRQVLALEPDQVQARMELARLEGAAEHVGTTSAPPNGRVRRWALGLLALAAALFLAVLLVWGPVDDSLAWLLPTPTPTVVPTPTLTPEQIAVQFVPQLQAALDNERWGRAVELVSIMQGVDPSGQEVQQWALTTHMQYGQALVRTGHAAEAQEQFDLAVAVAPEDTEALLWQRVTQRVRTGQEALEAGEWDAAIGAFTQAYEEMPEYGDLFARLIEAYRRKGQTAIEDGNWGIAIDALTQAYERAPDDPEIAALLSSAYRGQAQAALDDKDWTAAIDMLTPAHEELPQDPEVTGLLATAYRERGILRERNGKLGGARADLEAALALQPDDDEAQAHLDQVMYRLFPPKRIEIDISKQRFYAWEGNSLIYSFPTSTGLPGQDTATGHFRVLDKIPMAYSSIWRLKMPHWLGIYYVGNVENGIHGLPIRPDGSVMWGGLLGQRASYGCVILSTEAARIIYNWADIGTPVDIHY